MKTNSKKIIVSTLALAMGASLAGSVAGSVAWYQYSTRAAAQIQGISAGVTGDMAVRIDDGAWSRKAITTPVLQYMPISVSGDASGLTYYGHPVYQTESLPLLAGLPALSAPKVYSNEYNLTFRFFESETETAADAIAGEGNLINDKEVFLTYFEIAGDFAQAVRVEISVGAVAAVAGEPIAEGADGAAGVRYYTRLSHSLVGGGYLNDGTYDYVYAGTGDEIENAAANTYYPLTKVGRDAAKTPAAAGAALANGDDGLDGVVYYERGAATSEEGYLKDGHYEYTYAGIGDEVHADADDKYFVMTNLGSNGTYLFSANEAGEVTNTSGTLDLNGDTRVDTDYWDCMDTVKVAAHSNGSLANGEDGVDGVDYYTRVASAAGEGHLNDGTYAYVFAGTGNGTATGIHADADNKYFTLDVLGVDGGDPITYKNGTSTSYKTQAHADLKADTTDPYNIDGSALCVADGTVQLKVKVWLEGWATIGGKTTWDLDTMGQAFNVNMQFACNANK